MTATIWNASDKSAGMTLSNGSLEAAGGGSGEVGVRSTNSYTSGKCYFEYPVITALVGGGSAVGIANSLAVLTTMGSAAANAALCFDGVIYVSGSNTGINIGAIQGASMQVAVDLGAELIWMRNAGGTWNNSGTANPATGVGGIDISGCFTANTTAAYAAFVANGASDITVNFGATAFAYTIPAGFSRWDALGGGSSANWWYWL